MWHCGEWISVHFTEYGVGAGDPGVAWGILTLAKAVVFLLCYPSRSVGFEVLETNRSVCTFLQNYSAAIRVAQ